ncbi:MAG: NADH-quinone oxidoreductase subunit L [Clostridiales bacterium]|nr:NADH-quinone oxidoreductase subunit L [Clostridiales bacterium]
MNALSYISISFLIIPLMALFICILLKRSRQNLGFYLMGLFTLTQMGFALHGLVLFNNLKISEFLFGLPITESLTDIFTLKSVSLVILFCIGLVALVSLLIANKTMPEDKKLSYLRLLSTLILGMNGIVLINDLFTMYLFIEIIGISSFVLISTTKTQEGLESAFIYLVMSALASILILTGIAFIFMRTGNVEFSYLIEVAKTQGNAPQNALTYLSYILIISGLLIKTGAVPFHSWLPDAHQSADTSVSVLLSGIVIKAAGVYCLITVTEIFGNLYVIRLSLAIIGIITIAIGALFALHQNHFKRILAYSSVSQMGYMLLGISAGGVLGLIGTVFHIFNHAVFKSTLFTNAAAIHEETHTLEIDKMGGLQKQMPITATTSLIAFLSTAGIPPLSGFWSKLLIIIALWNAGFIGFGITALVLSIFTAAYFLRLQMNVFFGQTPESMKNVHEVGGSIKFAEVFLTIITVAVGLGFPFILLYLEASGIL